MSPDQEKKLNELHAAIVGNKELGLEGVIPRLKKVEDYQQKDKIFKAKAVGALAVGTPIMSTVLTAIGTWIKNHI